jgi:hypothetical protein
MYIYYITGEAVGDRRGQDEGGDRDSGRVCKSVQVSEGKID